LTTYQLLDTLPSRRPGVEIGPSKYPQELPSIQPKSEEECLSTVVLGFVAFGGGHIFFDDLPYMNGYGFGLALLWTFLINLGLFFVIATAVFAASREFASFKRLKQTVPYGLITVALGIPIDALFLFLADRLYQGAYGPGELINSLRHGYTIHLGMVYLLVPSVVALVLLFVVQAILLRVFFKEIPSRKTWIMSASIAFLTLPTWGMLILAAVYHGMEPRGGGRLFRQSIEAFRSSVTAIRGNR
jgi:hypothetical protein